MKLEYALRASDTKRWGIVNLLRPQSIAEHQYRVWLIVKDFVAKYRAAGGTLNSDDERLLLDAALTHDSHEVLTGDFPNTLKELANTIAPGVIKRIETAAREQIGAPSEAIWVGSRVEHLLKIADILETAFFAYHNGVPKLVWGHVGLQFKTAMERAHKEYPKEPWSQALKVIYAMAPYASEWHEAMAGVLGAWDGGKPGTGIAP